MSEVAYIQEHIDTYCNPPVRKYIFPMLRSYASYGRIDVQKEVQEHVQG